MCMQYSNIYVRMMLNAGLFNRVLDSTDTSDTGIVTIVTYNFFLLLLLILVTGRVSLKTISAYRHETVFSSPDAAAFSC